MDAARLVAVQFGRVLGDVGADGGPEALALQPLQQVALDSPARPVDFAAGDQLEIIAPLPGIADNPGKQPEHAAALLEVLHRSQPLLGGVEQAGMERVGLHDALGVGGRSHRLVSGVRILLHQPLVK